MKRLILTGSSRCGTTITRRILNSHQGIRMTNELRVFFDSNASEKVKGPCLFADNARIYFTKLKEKVMLGEGVAYHGIPNKAGFKNFVEVCMSNLEEDSIEGRIDAVLKTLAGTENFEYVGDKGVTTKTLLKLEELNVDYKLIVIYRDGRDAAVSGARRKRNLTAPWSNSPVENIVHWAKNYKSLFKTLDKLNKNKYIVIKFEDYILNPEKNYNLMSDFLEIENSFKKDLFKQGVAHMGYYNKLWPNWKKQTPVEAIRVLNKLGYV